MGWDGVEGLGWTLSLFLFDFSRTEIELQVVSLLA